MGYNFYRGRYTDALHEVLDTSKKTIIHIPNVNSGESTKDKYDEVGPNFRRTEQAVPDPKTGLWLVTEETGRVLKVADLVTEEGREKCRVT